MEDYMSEADNEVDGQYFADLNYFYEQKEIRRREVEQSKIKKEENRKEQLIRQNKCIDNLKNKLKQKDQRIAELEQELAELKEKAIVPKFKVGQRIWHILCNNGTSCVVLEDIITNIKGGIYSLKNCRFCAIEEELFSTEQEAQDKLKEIQGNE